MVRFKNRYVAIEITPNDERLDLKVLKLKSGSLYNAIQAKVQQLHGDFGVAAIRAGFVAKYCNEMTRIALIRVRHGPHRFVTTSIPFITSINSNGVTLRTLYTGATIKQCYRFIIKYQQAHLIRAISSFKTDKEKEEFRKNMLNLDSISDM